MPAELTVPAANLLGFLLVLARVSGVFVFVPLPGMDVQPGAARIVLSITVTLALFSRWPVLNASRIGTAELVAMLASEAVFGLTLGLAVSFLAETFVFGAQVLSLQAGFGYASTIDPATQADSALLQMLMKFTSGLLLLTTGLHRQLLVAFASSLDVFPPGSFVLSESIANTVVHLSSNIFSLGLRLAFPILGLLLMVDLSLALLNRLNQQLQLTTLAFSLKILISFLMLGWVVLLFPKLYQSYAGQVLTAIRTVLRH